MKRQQMGQAHAMASRMAQQIVLGRANLAQGVGVGDGARAPAGPARAPVELVELREPRGDGRFDRLTPIGYRTARVSLPRVLSDLPEADARRVVAGRYAHLVEKIGAMPCSGMEVSSRAGQSDGGATRRVGMAAELRALQACLQGVALEPQRQRGGRCAILLRRAVDMVCLEAEEAAEILRAHGWSARGSQVKALSAAILAALEAMAQIGD